MSRIFILEDNSYRISRFKRAFFKDEVFIFDNVKEAKAFLDGNDVDILFLDHDLDDRVYVDSEEENTGYQLAKYINESGKKYKQAIIHSLNTVGAANIYNKLKGSVEDIEIIPFYLLFDRILR